MMNNCVYFITELPLLELLVVLVTVHSNLWLRHLQQVT